jgi:hypothetical protein
MMNADERRHWGSAGHERLVREFRWDDKLRIAFDALTKWQYTARQAVNQSEISYESVAGF